MKTSRWHRQWDCGWPKGSRLCCRFQQRWSGWVSIGDQSAGRRPAMRHSPSRRGAARRASRRPTTTRSYLRARAKAMGRRGGVQVCYAQWAC
eukprot:1737524-Pleurochrysis_carterae.AAC.1